MLDGTIAAALGRAAATLAGRGVARQVALDVLAVLDGWKPLCLVGRGDEADADAVCETAAELGLPLHHGTWWEPLPPPGRLPAWYMAATARRRAATRAAFICRDDAALGAARGLCDAGRVTPEAEAALLGYPRCCVAQHHRQVLALERLIAERTAQLARGDAARMARMIEHGAEPLPATAGDRQRFQDATKVALAPGTGLAMCDACAGDPSGPAMRWAARYAALAARCF